MTSAKRPPRSSLLADVEALRLAVDRVLPRPDPHAASPVAWCRERLSRVFWTRQQKIARSVASERYTAVPSCHGSGKSFTAASIMAWWIAAHAPGTAFAVSTAPSGPQVKAILWRELGRAHRIGNLPGRITLDARWYWPMGENEELVAFGRKPKIERAGDQDLASAFQGIHAEHVLVVIDEAAGVPRAIFDAADTLATSGGSRILAIGNPDDPIGAFADACAPGSGWNTIEISAFDTPNFTGEKVAPGVAEMLVSKKWVSERQERWGEGSPLWQSKVLGRFPSSSEDTLISPHHLRAAADLQLPERRVTGVLTFDIARLGSDETVGYRIQAGRVRRVMQLRSADTMTVAGRIGSISDRLGRNVPIIVDTVGVGGGVFDRLHELGHPVVPFDAGGRAHQPRRFANRRAEVFWGMREAFEAQAVDMDGGDDRALAQLGSIRYFVDSRSRIAIEAKDDAKKRGLPSPDRADAIAQGWAHQDAHNLIGMRATGRGSHTSDLLSRPL
jgi:hypothetical protein